MKYMLMMHTPGTGAFQIASWPPQDIKAHIAFMISFAKKLSAAGEMFWTISSSSVLPFAASSASSSGARSK